MSQRCKIIPERCIACGLCAIYAPEIFDYDEDGIVLFAQEPNARQQFISQNCLSQMPYPCDYHGKIKKADLPLTDLSSATASRLIFLFSYSRMMGLLTSQPWQQFGVKC